MTMEGVALGATLVGLITPRAPSNDILNQLIKDKPEFYKFVDIDLSTARTDQPYDEPGTFIWVDNQFARGEVTLRLNELKFGKFDLRRQKYVQGPFYRFFITNLAGQGLIRLFVSRGYQAASEPIEAINRAELAVRLGSPVSFDRRGDVIWFDDFEDGVGKWDQSLSGSGAEVSWSSQYSYGGGFSCKLTMGTSSSRYANINRYVAYPVLSKLGLEYAFAFDNNVRDIYVWISVYDGASFLVGAFNYDHVNSELQYYNAAGGWTPLATAISLYYGNFTYHNIKVVIDFINKRYVRAILDSTQYDLSSYTIYEDTPDTRAPFMIAFIGNTGDDTTNGIVHVDKVVMTQNEP